MVERVQIDKTRAVIRGMLALLAKKKVGRTELVKLVYLCDNRFYESSGRTITGNTYMWDHFGPNAVGDAIANEANEMANSGSIRMAVRGSIYGGSAYDYGVDDPSDAWLTVEDTLDVGERQVLKDIAKTFGRRTLQSLIKFSKDTRPFASAQQYGILKVEQDKRAQEVRNRLDSSGEFLEEAEMGFQDAEAGSWVSDDELDSFTKS